MTDPSSDQPQAAPPQAYAQPIYPPSISGAPAPNSDSKVLKAVLITVAIFVGLGVIAVGVIGVGMWYVAKSVHEVPSASFTENDLGIAIYPGAEPSLHGSRAVLAGKTMLNATFITADPEDKVIVFYQQKAGPNASVVTTSHGSMFRVTRSAADVTTVSVMTVPDGSGGKTYIRIGRITEAPASH
ncbi:MAG: hypothetical protein ABR928_16380 [Terracidiphilus sp.]|jgi:hypothetical protein